MGPSRTSRSAVPAVEGGAIADSSPAAARGRFASEQSPAGDSERRSRGCVAAQGVAQDLEARERPIASHETVFAAAGQSSIGSESSSAAHSPVGTVDAGPAQIVDLALDMSHARAAEG